MSNILGMWGNWLSTPRLKPAFRLALNCLALTGLVVALTQGASWAHSVAAKPAPAAPSLASTAQDQGKVAIQTAAWVRPRAGSSTQGAVAEVAIKRVRELVRAQGWQVNSATVTALGASGANVDVQVVKGGKNSAVLAVTVQKLRITSQRQTRTASSTQVQAGAGQWQPIRVMHGVTAPSALPNGISPLAAPNIGGNQDLGAIVGYGAILLPGNFSGDPSIRSDAINCTGCQWRRLPDCLDAAIDTLCSGVSFGCPPGQIRYQILLLKPPEPWFSVVGTVCMGPGDRLRSPDDIAQDVRGSFVELLPRAHPSYQPANGALVNLPALFAVNEPKSVGPIYRTLTGYRVSVSAHAIWRWNFMDGSTLNTGSPGGKYPNKSVQHTYSSAGQHRVGLTSIWTGEFSVDGQGPFLITGGPIRLRSSVPVAIRPAAARLILAR